MPVYQFSCDKCGAEQETICWFRDRPKSLPCECGGRARHVFATGDVYCGNQDAGWLKTVHEVIDPETTNPVAREFIKHPTRQNYKAWMKSEGIRPLENNEPIKPPPTDTSRIKAEVWRRHRERHRIEI